MLDQILNELFKWAISVLIPLLMGYLLLYLKKIVDNVKNQQMKDFVKTAVKAAQQKINEKDKRFDYVADLVSKKYPFLKAETVDALIESAVHELKTFKF